ncbi:hypothetical protein B0H17DRAFT_849621, partial [Mycena rosella]
HPAVVATTNCIAAAFVQVPFLSLCNASRRYHLPSCIRLLEAAHVPKLLRVGPVHIREIVAREQTTFGKCSHILRLLATHHLLREATPDVFATNRISSLLETGKLLHALVAQCRNYGDDTSGGAAFVGLCTDELYKSSAYLT